MDYSEIPIITMTAMAYFKGEIVSNQKIFHLLPVTRLDNIKVDHGVKKIELPVYQDGTILFLGLGKNARGMIRSRPKGQWINSVSIYLSVSGKNLSLKLSKSNIQMCGAKNLKMCQNACQTIIKIINSIDQNLRLIQQEKELAESLVRDVISEGITGAVLIKEERRLEKTFDARTISREIEYFFDQKTKLIRDYLIDQVMDCYYASQARKKLSWVLQQTGIIDQPLEIEDYNYCMIKQRFNIGYDIIEEKFVQEFSKRAPEFHVDFFPDIRDYCVFNVKCCLNKDDNPSKIKKHTFSLKQNGKVTYSTLGCDETEPLYRKFVSVAQQIRPLVEKVYPDEKKKADK